MKVRLANKSVWCFVLLILLVSCSIQAAADTLDQIVRIATVDARGDTRYISTPRAVAEKFHVFGRLCSDVNEIDFRDHSLKTFLSYESLSELFACVASNPDDDIACYDKLVMSWIRSQDIKDKNEFISRWLALDYLNGPKNFEVVVVNHLEAMDLINKLGEGESLSPLVTLETTRSLYTVLNTLSKEGTLIKGTTLDLSGRNIYFKGIKWSANEVQHPEAHEVDLSANLLKLWDSDLSKVISHIAPNVRFVNLSGNKISSVKEGAFQGLPEGCRISLAHNCLDDRGISDATCCGGRGIIIDLRNNRISEQKGIELKQSAQKRLRLQGVRHYLWTEPFELSVARIFTVTILGTGLMVALKSKELEVDLSAGELVLRNALMLVVLLLVLVDQHPNVDDKIVKFSRDVLGKEYRPNRIILNDDDDIL